MWPEYIDGPYLGVSSDQFGKMSASLTGSYSGGFNLERCWKVLQPDQSYLDTINRVRGFVWDDGENSSLL